MNLETFKLKVLSLEGRVYGLSLRLLTNTEDARDAVQEVFVKLWNHKDHLEKYKNLEAFALTVTRNHCLDKIKAKTRRRTDEIKTDIENNADPNPHEILERKDAMDRVHTIFKGLPEEQRTIVYLRDVEGYEFDEIAEITNMTVNNVRVVLSRGRKRIRETLLTQYNNHGDLGSKKIVGKIL